MYLRFILDPFVPHGTNKVIRRVIKDLRGIFKDITYSVEIDESLKPSAKQGLSPVARIFQRRLSMNCRGIAVYIVNFPISHKKQEVYGVSLPDKCVMSTASLSREIYYLWMAKTWEVILHEIGHSFGLIKKHQTRFVTVYSGTRHCLNDCVMSEDRFDFVWNRNVTRRFSGHTPFCEHCLAYLHSKDI